VTTPSGARALAVALLLALAPPPAAAQSDRAEARLLCEGLGGVPAARRLVACEWLLLADRENPLDLAWALNRRGGIRMQAGDHAGALADFDAALRQDPRQAAATFNRAMLLARMDRQTEAEAAFGASIALNPRDAQAWRERGDLRRLADRLADAEADFDEAIRLKPRDVEARLLRAITRGLRGDPAGALADLDDAARQDPDRFDVAYYRALTLRRLGRDIEAAAAFTALIDRFPEHHPAQDMLCEMHRFAAQHVAGQADGDAALRRLVPDREVLVRCGLYRHWRHDRAGALADFDAAIRLDPALTWAWISRGTTRLAMGDPQGAIADFDEALRLDPSDSTPAFNRGNAWRALGEPRQAVADYTLAIRLSPDHNLFLERGATRAGLGDLVGAEADFSDAIRLSPRLAPAYLNRAGVRRVLRNLDGAAADADVALRARGWHAETRIEHARILLARNDPAAAIISLDVLLARQPQHAMALALGCIARGRLGQAEARPTCDRAVQAAPEGFDMAHLARAGLALLTDDAAAALPDIAEALRRQPNGAEPMYLRAVAAARETRLGASDRDRAAARARDHRVDDLVSDLFGAALRLD